jgi:hypothetical protein
MRRPDPTTRFAWLAFQGRWGQRQASPNDGPTGPLAKPRWSEPITWQDGLRESSFVVPGGSAVAPAIIETFCNVVGQGPVLFINFVASPARVLTGLVVLALLLAFLLRRTSWRPVPPRPVVARRRTGEMVRAATVLYRSRSPSPRSAFWPITIVLVSAAGAALLEPDGGKPPERQGHPDAGQPDGTTGDPAALLSMRRRAGDLASSFVPAAAGIGFLSLTVLGLPFAAWLTVRFQFLAQVTMLEGLRGRRALARSSGLVRHRWLHTALIALLVWAAVGLAGVVLGLLLLVTVTGLPLWTVSAAVVICQVALVPLGAIVMVLLYGDEHAEREDDEPDARALINAVPQ